MESTESVESMDLAREAVTRGVALLDQHGPEGWRDRIDREALDIADGWRCVWGQAFMQAWLRAGRPFSAPYGYGRDVLARAAGIDPKDHGATTDFVIEHGVTDFITDDDVHVTSEDLAQAWIEALSA